MYEGYGVWDAVTWNDAVCVDKGNKHKREGRTGRRAGRRTMFFFSIRRGA